MASVVAALSGHQTLLVVLAGAATLVTVALLARLLRAAPSTKPPAAHPERRSRFTTADVRQNPAEALALVGDALAATHNPRALLPVILEVLIEATGSRGGRVREAGDDVSWMGDVDPRQQSVVLELAREDDTRTELLLYAPEGGFTNE